MFLNITYHFNSKKLCFLLFKKVDIIKWLYLFYPLAIVKINEKIVVVISKKVYFLNKLFLLKTIFSFFPLKTKFFFAIA